MSAAVNRPTASMSSATRSSRLNGYQTSNERTSNDDKTTQNSAYGQTYGNTNAWPPSGNIWSSKPIGSGLSNGKRDPSRNRVEDESSGFKAVAGLSATSEEDSPWNSAQTNGPWNPDTTSPTSTSHSGTTSPVRSRTANTGVPTMILSDSNSPFANINRTSIRQGTSLGNRAQAKSNLDPSSGTFKYPTFSSNQDYSYQDEKENTLFRRESTSDIEGGNMSRFEHRGSFASIQGASSREPSLPSSRQSDHNPNGMNNGYFSQNINPTYGHTPNNSIQRPMVSGRTPSLVNQSALQGIEMNLSAINLNERVSQSLSMNSSGNEALPAQMWKNGMNNGAASSFQSDAYQQRSYGKQFNTRIFTRDGAPSALEDDRNAMSPKFYSETGSPLDIHRSPVSRPSTAYNRGYQNPQLPFGNMQPYGSQMVPPYLHEYDPRPVLNPDMRYGVAGQFGYQHSMPPYGNGVVAPRGPANDRHGHDSGHGVRSTILDEFRSNSKSNRRYELKDIYGHVVEFSGDQHGSRFIQQKLETANSDEKDQIFREIEPNALQLMTDVFGNYVIQKMFEHGNQVQKRVLGDIMRNHVPELSLQMYGCRVVQKAMEHVLADQQALLVKELEADVLRCVKDQNGNHVIQKAIERVPAIHIRFIFDAFKGQVCSLATHTYGCRVVQRMLEYCAVDDQAVVLDEIFGCAPMLITDQYGNYVIQHIIQRGKEEDKARIIQTVTDQLLTFSKHKFASNVVEKTLQFSNANQRSAIIHQMTKQNEDGTTDLQVMMKDQYGNYVVQKLLALLKGDEKEHLIELVRPQLLALKKYNFGKQIAAMEKLVFAGQGTTAYAPTRSNLAPTASSTGEKSPNTENTSITPTPTLTTEQSTPQSSNSPSTSVSTVDTPTLSLPTGKSESLEVRIESA